MTGHDDDTSGNGSGDSDQLQPGDTLDDRGVEDILDEGIVTRERWSPGQGFGNTAAEERQGESLDQRIAQEEPDPEWEDWDEEDLDDDQVGDARSGRLVAPDEGVGEDTDQAPLAFDAGIDGGGASAEEAAMHVVPDDEGEY
jgi:Family of unknown function (DUF5709)